MAIIYHATLENLLPTVGDSELVAGNGAVVNEDHLSFPNYNSGVHLETPIALGDTYTLSMWFKDLKDRGSAQGGAMMFDGSSNGGGSNGNHGGSTGGYLLHVYTGDELGAWDTGWRTSGYVMTQADYTGNGWHHIVASYDNGTVTYYINGAQVGNTVSYSRASTIEVFGSWLNYSYGIADYIDDIQVYDNALSAGDVSTLFAGGRMQLADGLVAKYALDTDAVDSVGSNDGTATGVTFENGYASFSAGDEITTGPTAFFDSIPAGSTNKTLSAWVKIDSYTPAQSANGMNSPAIFAKGDLSAGAIYFVMGINDGYPSLYWFDGSSAREFKSTTRIDLGTWVHLSLVIDDSNTLTYYVNGVATGDNGLAFNGMAFANGGKFSIGAGVTHSNSQSMRFAGDMDDLRIWDRELSASEVATLYSEGADAPAAAPPAGSTVDVTFVMQDSYGDGWNGSTFEIYDADSNIVESHTLAGGYGPESVSMTLDAEAYTWAFVSQSYMNEITATLTRDDTSEQILFSSAGSVLSGAFDLTPPSPVISPTLAASNGEITISATLNAEATAAGATGWAYALTDIFVEGQVHGGTAMAIGADATESPTPQGVHTIYVAAIDAAGLVIVANSASIDNSLVISIDIIKNDSYGDGWNGTMLVITNASGVEVYNATLTDAESNAGVAVTYSLDLPYGTYSWLLDTSAGGNQYPSEQTVTITLNSNGTVLAHSAAHSPSNGSFEIAAPGAGDDAGEDDGGDAVDLISGLVAKYAFDSDGVDSVGSNDGTNANVTFADGAAQFNGSNARFTLASEPFTASDSDYTISVWAKHDNVSSTQRLLGWGDTNGRYFVGYATTLDKIYIGMGDIDIVPSVAYKPVAGQVEHWVFSNSGNTTKFYKDGALVDTVVHGATGAISAGVGMRIGSVYMEFGEYLDGSMDDLRIWDRQLSDAEVTALYDAGVEVAGGAYDWTFGGQLSNIVKMVKGYDVSGSRSFMFLKNAGGDSDIYITPALADFDAYNLMTSGEHGWSGAPVCGEHGPASCFAFGTSDGNLYKVSLSDYGVPDSSSLIHAFGAGSVNSVNYSPTTQEWIVEHDSKVYTIPYAGGAPSLRMTLPAGSKVVDFAPADDAVALTVQLADFTFARYFALIGWATVHDYTGMAAIVESIGATDFNYDYDIDMWVAAAADGTTVSTDDINNWLL